MNVTVNDISTVRKQLLVDLEAGQIAEKLNKFYEKARKSAKLKGFRPGKAPLNVIKRLYKDQVRMEAMEELVQDAYSSALDQFKLAPLAAPEIADLDFPEDNSKLSFAATLEVLPEFAIETYADIELKKHSSAIAPAEVDAEMEKLRQSMAQFKTIDERPSQTGDTLVIDFTGRLDGIEFPGGSAEDFTIEVGSGRFIADLERQLVGLELGQSYELEAVFPEDYNKAELAGKKTVFTVKVKSIREKEVPELDDELAIQLSGGEMETLAELREKMTEYVTSARLSEVKNKNVEELLAGLRSKVDFELPECLLNEEKERAVSSARSRFLAQGLNPELVEQLLTANSEKVAEEAANTVKNTLILEHLAAAEKIESTPEELNARFQRFIQGSGENPQAVFERFRGREAELSGMLSREVVMEKTIEHLLSKVSYKESENDDAVKEESAAE
ncbi:MAG: trigger factor [Deltaproteobacteria bacterium]|nr:trigger factor [Deltaproteobacteria bacterium]